MLKKIIFAKLRYFIKETKSIKFVIRKVRPDEKGTVEKLFERSLGIVDRIVLDSHSKRHKRVQEKKKEVH